MLLDSKIFRCNSMSDHPADYMMDKTYHKSGLNHVSKTELCNTLAIWEYNIPTVCDLWHDQGVHGPEHPGNIYQP